MVFAGYMASVFIGIALGLIGGGGSILTVPVLVYLFHISPAPAAGYSLFIVGFSSAAGVISYFKQGLVHIKTALFFGIPSVAAIFTTRAWLVPAIPDHLFTIGNFVITKSMLLMLLFAALMMAASYSMIKKRGVPASALIQAYPVNYGFILAGGSAVGLLAGLVGAGGGFLIIPALLTLGRLSMKEAIGTSLLIIAVNSLLGFLGGSMKMTTDWPFLLTVTAFATIGIFIGMALSRKIDGSKLKPVFGWFILAMGIYILVRELC